jgi:acyl-CoA reductase-like NAD-dependent aldehyde dehydrogenase
MSAMNTAQDHLKRHEMLIDGEFVASATTLPVVNPTTGQPLRVPSRHV